MAIEIKYAVNMAKQYNEANEFNIEDYLLADNETGKLFLTESPSKRVLNESEKSALYFLIDDSLFNASAMYEMYDSGNNKLSEFLIPLGYNHLIHNSIPVNLDIIFAPLEASRIDVSIVTNQNQLTFESQFDSPAWTTSSSNAVVTPNTTIAPDGTLTADSVAFTGFGFLYQEVMDTVTIGSSYTFTIYTKTPTQVIIFGGASPAGTDVWSVESLADGWYTQSITRTFSVNTTGNIQCLPTGTDQTVIFWNAQLISGTKNYLTEIKSYQIDRDCYNYLFQVNWLNKLGGRDTFMFGAKPIIETSVDRNNLIELSKLRNFESPKRIYGYREHISRKTYTLSHRCKDRDTAEWVKRELIDSIDVMMVINDYYYPVLVLNSSIQEDKVSHDYIVTFQLRLAFDNNIQTR